MYFRTFPSINFKKSLSICARELIIIVCVVVRIVKIIRFRRVLAICTDR